MRSRTCGHDDFIHRLDVYERNIFLTSDTSREDDHNDISIMHTLDVCGCYGALDNLNFSKTCHSSTWSSIDVIPMHLNEVKKLFPTFDQIFGYQVRGEAD